MRSPITNLETVTDNLDEKLKEFEFLRQETVEKIEKNIKLDERFAVTRVWYEKLTKALALRDEEKIQFLALENQDRTEALTLDNQKRAEKRSEIYQDLSLKFRCLREQVQENYGTSTYSDCKCCLDKIEGIEDSIVQEVYPAAQNTVSKAMKPIIRDADVVNSILNENGIVENPYSPEARRDSFQQKQREAVRKLLKPKIDLKIVFKDLIQFASDVHQAKAVITDVNYIKMILKRDNQNGISANKFDETWSSNLRQMLHDALLEAAHGRYDSQGFNLNQAMEDVHADTDDPRIRDIVAGQGSIVDVFEQAYSKETHRLQSSTTRREDIETKACVYALKETTKLIRDMKKKWPEHAENIKSMFDIHRRDNPRKLSHSNKRFTPAQILMLGTLLTSLAISGYLNFENSSQSPSSSKAIWSGSELSNDLTSRSIETGMVMSPSSHLPEAPKVADPVESPMRVSEALKAADLVESPMRRDRSLEHFEQAEHTETIDSKRGSDHQVKEKYNDINDVD